MNKIIFFKDGKFPNISESHITNKIKYLKNLKKYLLCKRLNYDNKEYIKKLSTTQIIQYNKQISILEKKFYLKKYNLKNIVHNIKMIFFKIIRKIVKISKDILVNNFNYKELKINNINVAIYYLCEKIIYNFAKLFHIQTRLTFYQKVIKKINPEFINCCYGWEIIPLSIIINKKYKIILDIRGKDLSILKKYKFIRKLTKKHSILFLTRSNSMKNELIKLGFNKDKIKINHSGCDLNIFKYKKINKIKTLKIITIGRLVEKKGHITLLKACKKLKENSINFEVTIIGDGPLKEKIEHTIKKLKLDNKIKLLGNIPNKDIKKYLELSNTFILTSETSKSGDIEGIPVALMESMASGLICISTKHSGIPELLQNNINGFLINEKDHKNLYKQLTKLITLKTQELNKITFNARQKIEKEFNAEKQANEFKNIIHKTRY